MDWGTAAEVAAVAVPLVSAAGLGARWAHKRWRVVEQFLGDWNGQPARPGVAGRAGVMPRLAAMEHDAKATRERVEAIEAELHPNSGHTLRDAVQRIEQTVGTEGPPDD